MATGVEGVAVGQGEKSQCEHEIVRVELCLEHALQGYAVVDVELDDGCSANVGGCGEDSVEVGEAERRDVEDIAEPCTGAEIGDDIVVAAIAEVVGVIAAITDHQVVAGIADELVVAAVAEQVVGKFVARRIDIGRAEQ